MSNSKLCYFIDKCVLLVMSFSQFVKYAFINDIIEMNKMNIVLFTEINGERTKQV